MADVGMFGLSPDQIAAQRQTQIADQAQQFGTMGPLQRAASGWYSLGANAADQIGSAMGYEDPAITKAKTIQNVINQSDMSTSNGLYEMAREFAKNGLANEAGMVTTKANELKKQEDAAKLAQQKEDFNEKRLSDAEKFKNLPPEVQARLKLAELQRTSPDDPAILQLQEYLKNLGKGEWGDTYQLGGATVQKNLKTGEIRTAVTRAPITKVSIGGDTASAVSEPTLDMLAYKYLQTGELPSLGMGVNSGMLKTKILERAQRLGTAGGNTPEQVASNIRSGKADTAAAASTVRDFSSGLSSRKVTALNTALNHLDTMDKLSDELANSDTRIFNQAANAIAAATGNPAPTSFDAARQLVASEVIKAVVANGGGVTERQEAAEQFARANSPQQLRSVIDTYKELLGGQLSSLSQQYETGSGRKDFTTRLSPATKSLLEKSKAPTMPNLSGTKSRIKFDAQGNMVQ